MSAITDIRCVLTQKALDAFCDKFHIPEEVHPVLPNQNDTMHERPAGKIGLYTRFFDYANFRLPLSTFLVNVLRHFPDFNSTLQKFREVDFPLLAELKSCKDASTKDIMNVLRLEGDLADAPGMNDLQPDIEQLKVPIYRSEDQVVLGETSLSFALSVSHSRVERIRENIAAQRSALVGVWTPLSKP
ncbi:hypothetical protein Tco_0219390, partial [Tanacetum coccineum]